MPRRSPPWLPGGLAAVLLLLTSCTSGGDTATVSAPVSTTAGARVGGPPGLGTASATRSRDASSGTSTLVPVVSVIDGDTIRVVVRGKREKVRIIGMDAPELAHDGRAEECYGRRASSRMQSLVQSREVRLAADPSQADRDRYGRLLRHVLLPDGRSVALELIRAGFAREYTYDRPYRGQASYRAAERAARDARRGLWGACVTGLPAPLAGGSSSAGAPSGCLIKGNISSDGEKIYHVPGQRYYDVTVVTPSKGERWFCTEAEALAAGWRKALV